jgi:hypothetical protein
MASHPISFNPYAPPKARVDAEVLRGSVLAFPRFSAWFVFLLCIVTLGLYPLYWLYTRTKIANRVLPSNPISMGLAAAVLTLATANLVIGFLSGADANDASLRMSLATWAIQLAWIFQLRARLSEISNKPAVGGVMTFFFGSLYFQYKINEFIDELHEGEIALGDDPPGTGAAS